MISSLWKQVVLTTGLALLAFPQGLDTTATKEDWEEINFAQGSSILSDGYPSLLRLAELLKKNPGYKVKLEGHGDDRGSDRQNEKLGMARANAVKAFLQKYGAAPNQVETSTRGRKAPKGRGRSVEAQFMNRRVNVTAYDDKGRVVGDGGGSLCDTLDALQKQLDDMKKKADNSGQVLSKLDKLDDIWNMLRDMKNQNDGLRAELDALKRGQSETDKKISELPKPLSSSEVATITETSATEAINKTTVPRFTLLGINAGVDDSGKLTFSGKARYFAPFKNNWAFQGQGEYLYFRDRKEGQFDLGMVYRYKNFQPGLFGSFKNVQINDLRAGGTLGQAALTMDYIFSRGKVGVFGTKAFLDNRVLTSTFLTRTLEIQNVLKAIDQVGAQTTLALVKDVYLEGNIGYLKSYGNADRPGGTLRFVFPLNQKLAFTLEGGMNETLLARSHNGRVVAGLQFGNFIRPKDFKDSPYAVPADVPRVRYEILTRRVRNGNEAPVADAGPDQIGVQPGDITLDGSASFDPEGDAIRFQWTQIAGPAVSIAGATTSKAVFGATEGNTYGFRLTVTDDKGASSVARVNVTTARTPAVRILSFKATPQQIRAGESSTLTWAVENADSVTIDGIGNVNAVGGNSTVSPQQTTTYRLTARNRLGEVSETVTVAVQRPDVRIIFFQASPMTLVAGQSSTLSWQTENAETVDITGIGRVAQGGTTVVTPTENTTYVLTARNAFGAVTAQVAVQVNPAPMPRVVRFSAAPIEIVAGETSTLVWQVENATDVSISPSVGEVALTGSTTVTPTTTTTYTLVARNASGEVTATATVTVFPALRILNFTANPATSTTAGGPVTLQWTTEGATEAAIDGIGAVQVNGSVVVNPQTTTTYTLRAFGRRGSLAARVEVVVRPTTPPIGSGPVADAGPDQVTLLREIKLDGSRSVSPDGLVIGFSWRALGRQPELILGADTATPTVRFANLAFGEYIFELTVTDSRGAFAKDTTRVFFGAY